MSVKSRTRRVILSASASQRPRSTDQREPAATLGGPAGVGRGGGGGLASEAQRFSPAAQQGCVDQSWLACRPNLPHIWPIRERRCWSWATRARRARSPSLPRSAGSDQTIGLQIKSRSRHALSKSLKYVKVGRNCLPFCAALLLLGFN